MTWSIVFDFPEVGEPVFSGWVGNVLGLAPTLESAVKFTSEEAAQKTLDTSYSPSVREWGAVVELENG